MKENLVQDRNKPISKYSKVYPIDLSAVMNTLTCGLNLRHDKLILLPYIMSNARELVYSYYICFLFMIHCCMSLSIMHTIGTFLHLPPFFSELQVINLNL